MADAGAGELEDLRFKKTELAQVAYCRFIMEPVKAVVDLRCRWTVIIIRVRTVGRNEGTIVDHVLANCVFASGCH